jgi:hypothetical protein
MPQLVCIDTLRAELEQMRTVLSDLYDCNVWDGQIDDGDLARLMRARLELYGRPPRRPTKRRAEAAAC